MAGASLVKILKFVSDGTGFTQNELYMLLIGMLVAYLVSMLVIKFLMSYIRKHDFKPFGIYRIILGIAVLLYFTLS